MREVKHDGLLNLDPSNKREVFHKKALALILDKGFRGTTMRDLAESMQCDVSNIYNYIPSKQALLKQHVFLMSQRFHQGIDEIAMSGLSAVEQIGEVIRFYVGLSFEAPYQTALLVYEWRHLEEPDRSLFLTERKAYEDKVRKMITHGIRVGEFKKISPDTATHLILSSLRWLFQYVKDNPQSNRIKVEREISSFVLRGIASGSI